MPSSISRMMSHNCTLAGGHLNPAVTLGFFVTRKISLLRALTYMVLQCGGACAGSALVKAVSCSSLWLC